jgi:uncharacterized protein
MDLTPRIPADRQVIQGYGAGGFRISQVRHEGGVLVFPDRVLAWPAAAMADVTAASLEPLRGSGVELLLLGCGRAVAYAPAPLRQTVRSWGIVIDAMDCSRKSAASPRR